MDSTGLKNLFRSDVVDEAEPFLWEDAEIYRYGDAAYKMFVRLTGGIADFISEATVLDVVAGQPIADLHPSILRIMGATRRSDNTPVEIINSTDLGRLRSKDYGQSKVLTMDDKLGPVRFMIIGMQKDKARLIQVPDVDDTIDMTIYRMPLEGIEGPDLPLSEVEEHHHIYLLDWMKHLAYKKHDADTYDPKASAAGELAFRTYCAQVKAEIERYKHKRRVVSYGGI